MKDLIFFSLTVGLLFFIISYAQKDMQLDSVCKTIALTIPQEDIDFPECKNAYNQYVGVK